MRSKNLHGRVSRALFSPFAISRGQALTASERLAAATTLTSSIEYLTQRHQTREGGLNDWRNVKDAHAASSPLTRRLMDLASGEKTTAVLHVCQAAVSAGLIVLPGRGRLRGAGDSFLALTTALLYPRHRYGSDGSDQVSMQVHAAAGIARLAGTPATQDAALWYLALQSNLSYLASGWVKVMGPMWRDASAMPGVLRTRTYGHQPSFELTRRYPRTGRLVGRGVLALECLFPVAYLAKGRLAKPVLASAAAFHTANGLVMGLGRFVTAFIGMHPAVAYTAAPKDRGAAGRRDDSAVGVAAAALGGAAVAAAVTAVQRDLRAKEGWPTSRTFTTRHGNVLQYETVSPGEASKPVLVFCTGLGTSSEQFAWITEAIARQSGYGVVTYARAGYAGSIRHAKGAYKLSESADDLADLVGHVTGGRRDAVLVGHSLGGEIARRAAIQAGRRVHAMIYLDSSHPAEFQRSEQQAETARRLREGVTMLIWSLRLGAGILLSPPDWVDALPAAYRKRAFAQYCAARTWVTARREWDGVEDEFWSYSGGELPQLSSHALVISAQETIERVPEQLTMHKELAQAHEARGQKTSVMIIDNAGHESLLVNATFGVQVAAAILAFLNTTGGNPQTGNERQASNDTAGAS